MEAQLRRELKKATSEITQLKQAAEQLQSDLADAESARTHDTKVATAKLARIQHNHKAELAKRAKEEKARAETAQAEADEALRSGAVAAAALGKVKDEHLDELRAVQSDFDTRLRAAG